MVEKHNSHLAPNYSAETARAALGGVGIIAAASVLSMAREIAGWGALAGITDTEAPTALI